MLTSQEINIYKIIGFHMKSIGPFQITKINTYLVGFFVVFERPLLAFVTVFTDGGPLYMLSISDVSVLLSEP